MEYAKLKTSDLVDKFTEWDKLEKEAKRENENIKAELQKRGLKYLEDKQLKTVQYHGSDNNYVLVQKTEKLETLNYLTLQQILKETVNKNVEKKQEIKYTFKQPFKTALTSVFTNNYETRTVDEILKEIGLSGTAVELAKKKLKGSWVKDKEVLEMLGIVEDLELDLYFLHQAMNYDKLKNILLGVGYEKEDIPLLIQKLKKAVVVGENTKISINYKK